MTNACSKCIHKDVCQYKAKYKELVVNYNVKIESPFDFGIMCNHFSHSERELISFNWFSPKNLFMHEL